MSSRTECRDLSKGLRQHWQRPKMTWPGITTNVKHLHQNTTLEIEYSLTELRSPTIWVKEAQASHIMSQLYKHEHSLFHLIFLYNTDLIQLPYCIYITHSHRHNNPDIFTWVIFFAFSPHIFSLRPSHYHRHLPYGGLYKKNLVVSLKNNAFKCTRTHSSRVPVTFQVEPFCPRLRRSSSNRFPTKWAPWVLSLWRKELYA